MSGIRILLRKIRIKNKAIFTAVLTTMLAGCLQARDTLIPTPTPPPTVSMSETATEGQIPNAATSVSATEPSNDLLDGPAQLEIIFAEFRSDNKGVYITSPFKKWSSQHVVSDQSGLAFYHSPSLSPDGETFIFAYDDGTGFRIYTMNKDGTDLEQLIHSDNILPYQRYPSWSPDGSQVAFTVFNKLYRSNSNGSNIQLLTEIGGLSYSVWSPDGKRIAFLAARNDDRSGLEIFTVDKDGKNMQAFSNAIVGEGKISWSPDGKRIAFRSLDGCGDISIIDVATGRANNLTETPYMEKDPAWSPDGNYIAFASGAYVDCEKYVAESPYTSSRLFLIDLRTQAVFDSMLLDGIETSLYEPAWWPTVVLQPNWKYSVTRAGSDLNVRESHSTSAKSLITLQQGDVFTALKGPVTEDNYQWWQIRTSQGVEGWCVDVPGWYMFEAAD